MDDKSTYNVEIRRSSGTVEHIKATSTKVTKENVRIKQREGDIRTRNFSKDSLEEATILFENREDVVLYSDK